MADWPVIGRLSKLQRTVFIERERKRTSGDQASEIANRLAAATRWCCLPRAPPATAT